MRHWATVVNITVAGGGNRGLLYYVNAVGVAARYWLLEGWEKWNVVVDGAARLAKEGALIRVAVAKLCVMSVCLVASAGI